MKNILIITNYYPPEIGAASNRIFHLAEGLQKMDFKVSVITPIPNYPRGEVFKEFRSKFKHTSTEKNITIHRLWIFASNSKNKLLRLIAMMSYSFSLLCFFIWNKIPKTVIVQSPPLLVAFTSIFFLKSKKRKIILNVSDLWPLAGLELGVFKRSLNYSLLEKIERYNYQSANLIMGQSEEILTHIKSISPEKETFLYRNYPKFETQMVDSYSSNKEKIKLVYAGLLGVAQGIYKLLQNLKFSKIEFHIYGSGSEKDQIENFISEHSELPIFYHGEVDRISLHKQLLKYDVVIIPLLNRIYGSVPSKIFEFAYLGLPMIYFGGGEGEKIITENKLGWIAQAGNFKELNQVISKLDKTVLNLELRQQIKTKATENFDLKTQLKDLTKII